MGDSVHAWPTHFSILFVTPCFSRAVLVDEKYILGRADSGAETDAINRGAVGIEHLETLCYFLMGVFTS